MTNVNKFIKNTFKIKFITRTINNSKYIPPFALALSESIPYIGTPSLIALKQQYLKESKLSSHMVLSCR